MGNARVPGPICSTRLGDAWIDDGTLCRTKSAPPGPVGAQPANPAKSAFDGAHAYSLAPEARRKRAIDLEIIGGDYGRSGDVRIDNEDYLKKLIEIGSDGKQKVLSKARDMQFFIVRGGGEGFLPGALRKMDARNNVTHWQSTNGELGETNFDENDLLAVFDTGGTLIGIRSSTTEGSRKPWNHARSHHHPVSGAASQAAASRLFGTLFGARPQSLPMSRDAAGTSACATYPAQPM